MLIPSQRLDLNKHRHYRSSDLQGQKVSDPEPQQCELRTVSCNKVPPQYADMDKALYTSNNRPVFRIRIRQAPKLFGFKDPDPDPNFSFRIRILLFLPLTMKYFSKCVIK